MILLSGLAADVGVNWLRLARIGVIVSILLLNMIWPLKDMSMIGPPNVSLRLFKISVNMTSINVEVVSGRAWLAPGEVRSFVGLV